MQISKYYMLQTEVYRWSHKLINNQGMISYTLPVISLYHTFVYIPALLLTHTTFAIVANTIIEKLTREILLVVFSSHNDELKTVLLG